MYGIILHAKNLVMKLVGYATFLLVNKNLTVKQERRHHCSIIVVTHPKQWNKSDTIIKIAQTRKRKLEEEIIDQEG